MAVDNRPPLDTVMHKFQRREELSKEHKDNVRKQHIYWLEKMIPLQVRLLSNFKKEA